MARENAMLISPKSSYYTFYSINGFQGFADANRLGYCLDCRRNEILIPEEYADFVVEGLIKWVYFCKKKRGYIKGNAQKFIERCRKNPKLPYVFPIGHLTRKQADEEFKKLPKEIQDKTVSDTRNYDFGGVFVKPVHPR
jgi:hypothetical protein